MIWSVDSRYPHRHKIAGYDLDSLCLHLIPATPETRKGRTTTPATPACIQVAGPIGGHRHMSAERLRIEADRLLFAADLLDTQAPVSDEPRLFEVEA